MSFLAGEIPVELGNLVNLQSLVMGINRLAGGIPESIFNISTLTSIEIYDGHLTGNIPSNIGYGTPNLGRINLGKNNLIGVIPDSISNATKLSHLSLPGNQLTGSIPESLGNLENLDFLHLGQNNFTSKSSELSFFTSLTRCRRLKVLWVENNTLNGYLPSSIGNLSSFLNELDISKSGIQGRIPDEIGNLSSLADLYLDDNQFNAFLPSTFKGLESLQILSILNGGVTGSVPDVLCQLKNLGEIALSRNKLTGSLPACLGNISSLRNLYLDSNQLSSSLPPELGDLVDLLRINLSSNSFNGRIPSEIGNLKAANSIDFSRNELSGNIPSTFAGLENLLDLSLAHNKLDGQIPESFGKILSLEKIDLSDNLLSGVIPRSMEDLKNIKYLNLSYNKLTGEVPSRGPFANLTNQDFLSNKALCGPAWLKFPPCRTRSKLPTVLKIVLPTTVLAILVLLSVLVLIPRGKKKKVPIEVEVFPGIVPDRISYLELERATNGFNESNLLGKGSFGTVYKGALTNGMALAVKVFNLQNEGAFNSFDTECEVLRNLRHRNLTKVISSCSNPDFRALVLEYMPNGNLEKWLYSDDHSLDLLQRLDIMRDVATALEYLHHGYSTPVIHCDLKPSNVLLDEKMAAHISDFGIAKLVGTEDSVLQTRTLATLGYIAPGKTYSHSQIHTYIYIICVYFHQYIIIMIDFRVWTGRTSFYKV